MSEQAQHYQQLRSRDAIISKCHTEIAKLRQELVEVKAVNAHLRAVKHVLEVKHDNNKYARRRLYSELEKQMKLNDCDAELSDLDFDEISSSEEEDNHSSEDKVVQNE